MTFGNLIKTMSTARTSDGTHLFRYRRDELGAKLLYAAGIVIESSEQDFETTITKWIDRKPPKNILTYFPHEEISEAEVINFLKRWTREKWKDLQKEFSKADTGATENGTTVGKTLGATIAKAFVVDCDTNDHNVFYKSLCYQLKKSLGLPTLMNFYGAPRDRLETKGWPSKKV